MWPTFGKLSIAVRCVLALVADVGGRSNLGRSVYPEEEILHSRGVPSRGGSRSSCQASTLALFCATMACVVVVPARYRLAPEDSPGRANALLSRIQQGETLHTAFKTWPLPPDDLAAAIIALAKYLDIYFATWRGRPTGLPQPRNVPER
jgi:hypothetical protein